MIDLGNIPRAILAGINEACLYAEDYVDGIGKNVWADEESEEVISRFERMLGIVNKAETLEGRKQTVLSYLNANGSAKVKWFYHLAKLLGYVGGIYENGTWKFESDHSGPAVYFTDGQTLPFRVGISLLGDKLYDNITYGATTCMVYYRQGDSGANFEQQLKDLIRGAKNLGTVLVFIKTN
jgi:hypothetical protein